MHHTSRALLNHSAALGYGARPDELIKPQGGLLATRGHPPRLPMVLSLRRGPLGQRGEHGAGEGLPHRGGRVEITPPLLPRWVALTRPVPQADPFWLAALGDSHEHPQGLSLVEWGLDIDPLDPKETLALLAHVSASP